ncbi:ExeM/NucH family extracellular endonuclease [Chloroflexota bacterium]
MTGYSSIRKIFALMIIFVMLLSALPMGDAIAAAPGDIVINEIMQNPSVVLDSAGEWFELYNPTGSDIDIDGWTIRDDGIDSHVISNGGSLVVPAGGYLVLGNNTDQATNGGAPVAYSYGGSWFLSNSADEVILEDTSLVEIDRVEYDGGPNFPDPTGASMSLTDPALDNNVGANWCEASTPFGDGDLGTPGAGNDCGGATIEIVINEIIQNPAAVSDANGEWFELYNPTSSDIDIDGWTIRDDGSDNHVIANGGPLVVPAGGYLVLGNNTDQATNGGAPVAYSYGSNWYLSNSADEVILIDTMNNEIDRVEYDGGPNFPDPTGASMSLIEPALDNNVGANWCEASTPFGAGDLGTPGAGNDCGGGGGQPLPLSEHFDDCTLAGWQIISVDADTTNTWKCSSTYSNIEANGYGDSAPADEWLITPPLNLDAQDWDTLTFRNLTRFTDVNYPQLSVLYSTDYTGGRDPSSATWVELSGINFSPENSNIWVDSGKIDISQISGTDVFFAFHYVSSGTGGGSAANWRVDAIEFFSDPPVCGDPATFIHDVQGPGFESPIVGQTVSVEAVVVGDFQESNELNGFFVQEEYADFDADIDTSEGLFIFEGSFAGPDLVVGDLVRVTGEVAEYYTLTQLNNIINVQLCGYAPGPYGPVDVTLPEEIDGDLEKVEGMNVNVTNTMSVAQNYFLGRYGQLTLSSDLVNRLFQPTNQVLPNTQASADLADYNARNLLFLDDGMSASTCGDNPNPVPYLGGPPPAVLRGGDQVSNLTGVLDYGQINSGSNCSDPSTLGRDYRLQPTQDPVFSNENPRTAAPDNVGGSLKVVSFNVLNFFNGDGQQGGFPTSRGAYNFLEFVRQRIKIYEAMKAIDGDIVGLMEIENDGFDEFSAIAELVKVLNEGPCWNSQDECADMGYYDAGLGAGTYAFIDAGPGPVGTDAITVGFIYKPASVTPVGDPLVIDDPAFTDPNNLGSQQSRPAIAQTFQANSDGALFTPIVNHLKSKGSPCGEGDDDPEQGSCNVTRTLGAEYLVGTAVPDVQLASGDLDVAIIGDLNAYAMEDPIRALTDGGLTNLVKAFNGDYAYSYTFDGMVGYLDHSLSTANLLGQATGTTIWHINTDEPAVIDYENYYNPDGYYSPDAYRASDHDPVIVGLDLNGPPVCTAAAPSMEQLWPVNHKFVPVSVLGVTDPESDPVTITIDEIWQDEPVNADDDGNTFPDGAGIGTDTAELRAERNGELNGRAYHVYFTADDGQNNSCSGEVVVYVPLNQGEYGPAIDDGPLYDSTVE